MLSLMRASQAKAYLSGRDFVKPDDVKALVGPVLRHRLTLTSEARIGNEDVDKILTRLVTKVIVPRSGGFYATQSNTMGNPMVAFHLFHQLLWWGDKLWILYRDVRHSCDFPFILNLCVCLLPYLSGAWNENGGGEPVGAVLFSSGQ